MFAFGQQEYDEVHCLPSHRNRETWLFFWAGSKHNVKLLSKLSKWKWKFQFGGNFLCYIWSRQRNSSGNLCSSKRLFILCFCIDLNHNYELFLKAFQTVLKSGGVSRAAGATTPRYPRRTERGSYSHSHSSTDFSKKINKW